MPTLVLLVGFDSLVAAEVRANGVMARALGVTNAPPTVAITTPELGASWLAPATFAIQAVASDIDGRVTNVAFFANGQALGSAAQAPFAVTVTNLPAGSYTLAATATDDQGAKTTSAPIPITVLDPVRLAPPAAVGNAIRLNWSGGFGPYLVQKRVSLTVTNWLNLLTTSDQSALVTGEGAAGFFRVEDEAPNTVQMFTVWMTGLGEINPPIDTPALAFGSLSLAGDLLSYHIAYTGLSGPPTMAHLHGPATSTTAASPLAPLPGLVGGTSGVISGAEQVGSNVVAALKAGQLYANLHSILHGGGEIRGQVTPVQWTATLSGTTEVPAIQTGGSGAGTFEVIGNQLFYDLTYSGLSSAATLARLHGPSASADTAAPIVSLNAPTGTDGTLTGSVTLTQTQLGYLADGLLYANILTANHSEGEIRGQLMPSN